MLYENEIRTFKNFIYDNFYLINELCDVDNFKYLTFSIYTDSDLFMFVNLKYNTERQDFIEIDSNFFIDSSFMSNIHEKEVSMKFKRYYNTCQLLLN